MNNNPKYTLIKTDTAKDASPRLAWGIQINEKTVGTVGIDLADTQYVESPSVRFAINAVDQDITVAVMKEIIKYAYCNLPSEFLYSRQQVGDTEADKINKLLGFDKDGEPYTDDDGIAWQNVKLVL